MAANEGEQAWFLKSSCPVLLPPHDALTRSQVEFDAFLTDELKRHHDTNPTEASQIDYKDGTDATQSETFTLVSDSTAAEIRRDLAAMEVDTPGPAAGTQSHRFIQGLLAQQEKTSLDESTSNTDNKMLTANGDVAHISTKNDLVDLFSELEDAISGPRLINLLDSAWTIDPLVTLKIIFNARSIHLGKSSRSTFYRAAGWLWQRHPLTLVANLRWLSRPVIEKKVKKDKEEDIVLVDHEPDENDPSRFDVKFGVAHGYWKDLLNMLALAVNDKFDGLSDPRDVLNSENPGIIRGKSVQKPSRGARKRGGASVPGRGFSRGRGVARKRGGVSVPGRGSSRGRGVARGGGRGGGLTGGTLLSRSAGTRIPKASNPKWERRNTRQLRHKAAFTALKESSTYRALHLTVARLFAEQLLDDLKTLRGNDSKAKREISLCGKWAPSHDHFHDRHTFIVSSIAEYMYPRESLDDLLSPTDRRETYLRYAREEYRKDISALRKHLEVVEREISAKAFGNIKYDRVPSLAMKNYSKLFIEKDFDRFEKYLDRVAEGKARISGATLLPSTIVNAVRTSGGPVYDYTGMVPSRLIEAKKKQLECKTMDGQWRTLVQRIKDSGALSSSIAVCDVSGSMSGPRFPDGTCPMDSAIGLSLLVAEVTEEPFGGAFITFSSNPKVERIDLSLPLSAKVKQLEHAHWGMNTDFTAVFESLILPMAIENKLKQEEMVKRIFVFSDMHFDKCEETSHTWDHAHQAGKISGKWSTSFGRIGKMYAEAGYELPELIFWNLAGGHGGYSGSRNAIAPKPVTTMDYGTSLVSGYSQGMLKVFLENGSFESEDDDSEDEVVLTKDEEGDGVTEEVQLQKKARMDPYKTVKKTIGHKAYDMLKVLD